MGIFVWAMLKPLSILCNSQMIYGQAVDRVSAYHHPFIEAYSGILSTYILI